jgi:PAS domain S-box-containing protein
VFALLLSGVYVLVHGSHAIYEAFGPASCIAVIVGVRRNRPPRAAAWYVVAAAEGLMGLGDAVYFSGYSHGVPYPSWADAFYVSADVTLVVGVAMLVFAAAQDRDLLSYVDAAVFALALGLLMWAAFFTSAFGDGTLLQRALSIFYPVVDLSLLGALVRLVLVRGRRTTSFYGLAVGVACLVLADAWYVVPQLTNMYEPGTWIDLGWLLSYTFIGYAALDPSMRTFVRVEDGPLRARRVVLLGLALATMVVAELVQRLVMGRADVVQFAVIDALMTIFVTIRVTGLVGTLDRIRGQAEASERRFRMVFERSPIGISVGSGGRMTETNPALQRMLGYSAEELAQMHYTEITHPDDVGLDVEAERRSDPRSGFSVDKRLVARNGRVLDAHVHVALAEPGGLGVALIEDVTGSRELEEQLRQAQKMEAIGKLAGGIAHDFNNLMTAVIGYSDLLMPTFEGDVRREKVEAIRESAVRAGDLTRQLLAFSRRQVMQTTELDLRDVVLRMDSLLRRLIGEDVRLRTVLGTEPVLVRADKTQLEQVVMNLVVNARDAIGSGGTIAIGVLSDGEEALLSVADDGVGIEDDALPRIFEPFFTTKAVGEGSGLGLSTAHGIVGQSGGRIDVVSAPGDGTVFTVRLPAHAPVLPQPATAATLVD